MTRRHLNRIRPDLKATLNKGGEGLELTIERRLAQRKKITISLKADEWQELMDWLRAISFLDREDQT